LGGDCETRLKIIEEDGAEFEKGRYQAMKKRGDIGEIIYVQVKIECKDKEHKDVMQNDIKKFFSSTASSVYLYTILKLIACDYYVQYIF